MSFEKVAAGAGVQWIVQAFSAIKRQPQVLLVMGLILAIIGIIPFLGGLVIFILGPALLGGFVYATRSIEKGDKAAIGDLMHAFRDSDRTGPMIALCLPLIVAFILSAIIGAIFFAGAIVSAGLDIASLQSNPAALLHTLGPSVFIAVPLILLVILAAEAMTFFAVSRVLLDKVDAFAAMKESFQAAWRNVGAFLIAIVLIAFGVGLLKLILNWLHLGMIGTLIAETLHHAGLGATMYYGYRALFGNHAAAAEVPPPAPVIPPPPPLVAPPAPPAPSSLSDFGG
ncbi:MAG: hypothetical protein L0H70_01150 [Xanthomonadales bacterium]|nr:hypothetical protein [Xanthomonadales bacterium]